MKDWLVGQRLSIATRIILLDHLLMVLLERNETIDRPRKALYDLTSGRTAARRQHDPIIDVPMYVVSA